MDGIAGGYFAGERIFGDRRLDRRLGTTFNAMALRPDQSLPRKLPGRAALFGGYRMLNHAEVTYRRLIESHRRSCLEQMNSAGGVMLLLHDTTVLDYSGLSIAELGQVGDGHGRGLYAHNTLAVMREDRRVVGLMNQILHQRACVVAGEKRAHRLARQDRESRLWRDAVAALPPMPGGVVTIDISDRGSDITEYLDFEVQNHRLFIVRSQHDRVLEQAADETSAVRRKLHGHLRGLEPMARFAAVVDESQKPRSFTLAWSAVSIVPPRQARGVHGNEPLKLWGVIVREEHPLKDEPPIEWMLLTNQPVTDADQARQVTEDYACRWIIEELHKGMKTGCGIEELQLTTRHGLDNAIGLLSVLAVHVLKLRCAARDEKLKHEPATTLEEPLKVQLAARASKQKGPWRSMTVWEFYLAVAKLGGYMANPLKRPPGWQLLWRGYIRLNDMVEGVQLLAKDV